MFTVTVTYAGSERVTRHDEEFCAGAWKVFGEFVTELAEEMIETGDTGEDWPVTHIRMVYALNVPGVELEYAHVTMA